jgi:hypothetical protein
MQGCAVSADAGPDALGLGTARHRGAALHRAWPAAPTGRAGPRIPHRARTPVNPNHASRAFARLAASTGLHAHPHMLRQAMAAHKELASIIAAQLRHADGGAVAEQV